MRHGDTHERRNTKLHDIHRARVRHYCWSPKTQFTGTSSGAIKSDWHADAPQQNNNKRSTLGRFPKKFLSQKDKAFRKNVFSNAKARVLHITDPGMLNRTRSNKFWTSRSFLVCNQCITTATIRQQTLYDGLPVQIGSSWRWNDHNTDSNTMNKIVLIYTVPDPRDQIPISKQTQTPKFHLIGCKPSTMLLEALTHQHWRNAGLHQLKNCCA